MTGTLQALSSPASMVSIWALKTTWRPPDAPAICGDHIRRFLVGFNHFARHAVCRRDSGARIRQASAVRPGGLTLAAATSSPHSATSSSRAASISAQSVLANCGI